MMYQSSPQPYTFPQMKENIPDANNRFNNLINVDPADPSNRQHPSKSYNNNNNNNANNNANNNKTDQVPLRRTNQGPVSRTDQLSLRRVVVDKGPLSRDFHNDIHKDVYKDFQYTHVNNTSDNESAFTNTQQTYDQNYSSRIETSHVSAHKPTQIHRKQDRVPLKSYDPSTTKTQTQTQTHTQTQLQSQPRKTKLQSQPQPHKLYRHDPTPTSSSSSSPTPYAQKSSSTGPNRPSPPTIATPPTTTTEASSSPSSSPSPSPSLSITVPSTIPVVQRPPTPLTPPDIIEEKTFLANGTETVARSYRRSTLLGKGGFAKVYLVHDTLSGKQLACKAVDKNAVKNVRAKQKLLSEIKIHRGLRHKNIVKFDRFFEDDNFVYILLEVCESQTLMDLLKARKSISEPEARYFMAQIIDAVKYMHKDKLVIHRDIKLGNLFLANSDGDLSLKIGDFGLAARLESDKERKQTICGTPNYIAPEILMSAQNGDGHSFEVDIWSIGVVLYTMLVGRPPFETSNVKSTYKRIRATVYTFPQHIYISNEAKSLISAILTAVPEQRPSIEDIESHPFFTTPSTPILHHLSPADAFNPKHNINSTVASGHPGHHQIHTLKTPTHTLPQAQAQSQASSQSRSDSQQQQKQASFTPASSSYSEPDFNQPPNHNDLKGIRTTDDHESERKAMREAHDELESSFARLQLDNQKHPIPSSSNYTPKPLAQPQDPPCPKNSTVLTTSSNSPDLQHMDLASLGPWVCKWIDYSSKYGLGYQLSNGSYGVLFNDNTKILMLDDEHGMYYGRNSSSTSASSPPASSASSTFSPSSAYSPTDLSSSSANSPPNNCSPWPSSSKSTNAPTTISSTSPASQDGSSMYKLSFTLRDFPSELTKKITLLKNFRNYLSGNNRKGQENVNPRHAAAFHKAPQHHGVFVKKWTRVKQATIFRISNGTIQVSFNDATEIVLNTPAKVVSYRDKEMNRRMYNLSAIPNIPQLVERLRFTKTCLLQLTSI